MTTTTPRRRASLGASSAPIPSTEWAGLPDDDPEIIEAKRLLTGNIDLTAPTLERSEQVYRFVMDGILGHDGARPHTDKLQLASPLETWEAMSSGREGGFCENVALIYYLFANAAGIPTRLVDIAGKFGPVKLTGHYFCESWIPEEACWCYVDPQMRIANVRTTQGKLLNFLELKKVFDLGLHQDLALRKYDRGTKTLVAGTAAGLGRRLLSSGISSSPTSSATAGTSPSPRSRISSRTRPCSTRPSSCRKATF